MITHKGVDNQTLRNHALKVVTVEEDSDAVLHGLIKALTRASPEFNYSTTVDFKLTPFQHNAIGRHGITQLITRQNNFLHSSMATSVVDWGDCSQFIDGKGSIREIALGAMSSNGHFLFDLVEPGKRNQCNFIHPKHVAEEAEQFLNKYLTIY